jgi:MFS family permease
MTETLHPAAIDHLPSFITAPGQTDWLFSVVVIFLLAMILIVGNLYFQLHALPEHMAHRGRKVQMEIVAVLALISLFTHNHLFWIAGLLLALIDLPDFSTPMVSIARSLEKLSGRNTKGKDEAIVPPPEPEPKADAGGEI